MECLARRATALLNNMAVSSHQSVRCKGMLRPQQTSWKPIPPKTRRDDYYMVPEERHWARPVLKHRETLAKKASQPPPEVKELHMVTRCKTLYGETKVCKKICEHFILEKMHIPAVIANTPSNNELLKQINHLIRVKPLNMPEGFPKNKSDMMHTQLRTDGTLHVVPRLEVSEPDKERTFLLQPEVLRKKNLDRVVSRGILKDYFKTEYKYKYNEDGKEYPYKPRDSSS